MEDETHLDALWMFFLAVLFVTTGYAAASAMYTGAIALAVSGVLIAYLYIGYHHRERVRLHRLRQQLRNCVRFDGVEAERCDDTLWIMGYTVSNRGDRQ